MEDGEKFVVPLDSGLDVHSSDMLVSAQEPLFQHNRQKFQGKYMPSSLRFEHDGWAAGWDVYMFELMMRLVDTSPEGLRASKLLVYDNPTYRVDVQDLFGKKVASLYLTRAGKVVSSSFDSAELAGGYAPVLNGSVNGKTFTVTFDPLDLSKEPVLSGNADIKKLDQWHEVSKNYVTTLRLFDEANYVDTSFGGMSFPSDMVNTDGGYTLAPFLSFANGVPEWRSDGMLFALRGNMLTLDVVGSVAVTDVFRSDNSYSYSKAVLVAPESFVDSPTLSLTEFFPFFTGLSAAAMSTVVMSTASDKLEINKQTVSMIDRTVLEKYSDKLYRNNDGAHREWNRQTLTHQVPVWFGVHINEDIAVDNASMSSALPVYSKGATVKSATVEVHISHSQWKDLHIDLKVGESYNKYDRNLYTAPVTVFENSLDATDKYNMNGARLTRKVTFKYRYTKSWTIVNDSSGETQESADWADGSVTLDVDTYWTGLLENDASKWQDMFSLRESDTYSKYLTFSGVELSDSISTADAGSITGPWLVKPLTYKPKYELASLIPLKFNVTTEFNDPDVLGKVKTDNTFGYKKTNTSWCCCCIGTVSSDLYIKDGMGALTQSNVANAFAVAKSDVDRSSGLWLDDDAHGADMFKHSIVSASCSGTLSVKVNLCAVSGKTYMFYCNAETDSEGKLKKADYCPGHILSGSVKDITSSAEGGVGAYLVNKTYSVSSFDMEYTLSAQVTGMPAMDNDGNMFNYITPGSMSPVIGDDVILSGNRFSEELYPGLSSALAYSAGAPYGHFEHATKSNATDEDCFVGRGQDVSLVADGRTLLSLKYGLDGGLPSLSGNTYTYSGHDMLVTLSYEDDGTSEPVQSMRLLHSVSGGVSYNLKFMRPWLEGASVGSNGDVSGAFTLKGLSNNIAELSDGRLMYKVDYSRRQAYVSFDNGARFVEAEESFLDDGSVTIYSKDSRQIELCLPGAYGVAGMTLTGVDASKLSFVYDGKAYTLDVSSAGLFAEGSKSLLDFCCVDTRDAAHEKRHFQRVDIEKEFQFLRQQWDTDVSTENFWYVDPTHVLALTKDSLVLRRKTGELHDWNGDVFEDADKWPRTEYITSDVAQYLCSCAYDGEHARFVTAEADGGNVVLYVYDPLEGMTMTKFTVPLNKVALGKALNEKDGVLNTYSDMSVGNLLSRAELSATCIGGHLLLGVHFDNNFNQWALNIDIEAGAVSVLQGYGYVGLNGCLTGGELPVEFCGGKGFNSAVQPLSVLSDTSVDVNDVAMLSALNNMVVGDDAQQWYVSKQLTGVVSHWTYSDGEFTAVRLPLNNNYSVQYASSSYYSSVYSNYDFKSKSFKDLAPDAGGAKAVWTTMLALFTWPIFYYLDPRVSVAAYLQQTLGQAAYVHYNSQSLGRQKDTESDTRNGMDGFAGYEEEGAKPEISAVSSDELSFDRQSLKQSAACEDPYSILLTTCAAALVSAADLTTGVLQVNKNQNQSAVSDMGRKYTQNFLQNLNSLSVSDMQMSAVNPTVNSEVTAVKTLDMFYSTSDGQKVVAGPGYVNHNFVAQCVSQSVTSVQAEITQQKMLYAIKAMTMFRLHMSYYVAQAAVDVLKTQIESMSGSNITSGGFVVIMTPSSFINIGLTAAWTAANIGLNTLKLGIDYIGTLCDSLGGGKLQSAISGTLSKHSYDIEGKHRYGSKSETFMWPCFGCETAGTVTDESAEVTIQNKAWKLSLKTGTPRKVVRSGQPQLVMEPEDEPNKLDKDIMSTFDGTVPYYIAMLKGNKAKATLPADMAYVIGADSFLSDTEFKNENIGELEPVFPTPPFQDYIIDKVWQLSQTASEGGAIWVSCKDTKLFDGKPGNMVVSADFCGVACPYTAIEVKRGISMEYLRPWAITPNALALNNTGFNCCYEEKAYHAFDGYGYRIVSWTGAAGMAKNWRAWQYSFLRNDRFKRSNKLPLNSFLGNFKSDPTLAISATGDDRVFSLVTQPEAGKGLEAQTLGEDKDTVRIAVPVFSEPVSTLPASLKTITTYTLDVVAGVTSLTSRNRDLLSAYKAPESVDFTIGKNNYRYTNEYICSLTLEQGTTVAQDLVPCLGLKFLGATPYEAYLYSPATRQYYKYTGGTSLQVVDMMERFRDINYGRYDFVNQEVVMPCLATFVRLDKDVLDDADETDNVLVTRLKDGKFVGELFPPDSTLFNTRSWFRTLSLPCGMTYQGPNRCSISRFVFSDYMTEQVKGNYGKWRRVSRERYHPFRRYAGKYESVDLKPGEEHELPEGWTHNSFLLVTSPLGVASETDCLFEWEVTFAWPVEMDRLYDIDSYAVVMLQAETMTPGGKVVADRPTHVYLTKELFTRTGNYGYYSFRYQSKCGAGNRERLHIWSDQYICVSALQVECKQVTSRRTEQLTQQVDVRAMKEL